MPLRPWLCQLDLVKLAFLGGNTQELSLLATAEPLTIFSAFSTCFRILRRSRAALFLSVLVDDALTLHGSFAGDDLVVG